MFYQRLTQRSLKIRLQICLRAFKRLVSTCTARDRPGREHLRVPKVRVLPVHQEEVVREEGLLIQTVKARLKVRLLSRLLLLHKGVCHPGLDPGSHNRFWLSRHRWTGAGMTIRLKL